MRLVPSAVLCLALLAAAPARAEDFTGFYAGINAGYALGRDGKARGTEGPAAAPLGASAKAGPDLPPSASQAARQMRGGAKPDGWALPR